MFGKTVASSEEQVLKEGERVECIVNWDGWTLNKQSQPKQQKQTKASYLIV